MMHAQTVLSHELTPRHTLFPHQTHGNEIIEIKTGRESLCNCDGLWSRESSFVLGIKTADCAAICFWDKEKHGIIHVGWRGLCNGIIEKMLALFDDPTNRKIFVGPILPIFEIQKDFCYDALKAKIGTKFFEEKNGKILFHFKDALISKLPKNAEFDPRATDTDPDLASNRQAKTTNRNKTFIGNFDVEQFQ